jgi:uncharacterized membrane protein
VRNGVQRIRDYFIFFLLYSITGWCYEVFLEVVVYHWGFSDCGVLMGPYCIIYGFGALVFLFFFRNMIHKRDGILPAWLKPLIIGVGCMLIATVIELAASYIMEIAVGSWPWQTYVQYRYNFQGRIALSTSLRFGLGGLVYLYLLQPLFEKLIRRWEGKRFNFGAGLLATVFGCDVLLTLGQWLF